ncbi:hypothetical protein MIS45_08295 [Wielerella bovis]|uniref:hypothetical protein n=1 Tax=Wielerella bovis TaxID=2917790 RepID=UPI00201994BC|nr:hypothetical protein [Wielerella bovis]ULJ68776.1 hypothetical protein MIS45_08295 [Wielerella bovis]
MPNHSDNIQDWIVSNRLYEDNLFYYALIICFWFFVGFSFLGFELEGFSLKQNLFFNFIYYLIICVCMALCPFWFRLFFWKTHTAKREQAINAYLDELDDGDRQEIIDYLDKIGQLAMRPTQRRALVFLGSYFLFEIFFISAWVKDLTLVWQPDWVMGIAEWIRANTTLPPLNVDRKLFMLDIHTSSSILLRQMYETEYDFLNSDFGIATLFFHFIRALNFFPILIAIYLVLSNVLGWVGLNKFKAEYQEISFFSHVKKFLWLSFLTFFLLLLVLGGGGKLFMDIEFTAEILNLYYWLENFYLHIGHVFFISAFFISISWFKTGVALVKLTTNRIKQFF